MQEFKKEARYAVFKLSKLTPEQQQRLYDLSMELGPYNSVGECVVVESDWPNYGETWDTIKSVTENNYVSRDQLQSERDALVAQTEALAAALTEIRNAASKKSGFGIAKPEDIRAERLAWMRLNEVFDSTPAACLAQVKDESHKAGFIMGCEYAGDGLCNETDLKNYAERIRQGGE